MNLAETLASLKESPADDTWIEAIALCQSSYSEPDHLNPILEISSLYRHELRYLPVIERLLRLAITQKPHYEPVVCLIDILQRQQKHEDAVRFATMLRNASEGIAMEIYSRLILLGALAEMAGFWEVRTRILSEIVELSERFLKENPVLPTVEWRRLIGNCFRFAELVDDVRLRRIVEGFVDLEVVN